MLKRKQMDSAAAQSIINVPDDVLAHIFSFLPIQFLLSCIWRVCRTWNRVGHFRGALCPHLSLSRNCGIVEGQHLCDALNQDGLTIPSISFYYSFLSLVIDPRTICSLECEQHASMFTGLATLVSEGVQHKLKTIHLKNMHSDSTDKLLSSLFCSYQDRSVLEKITLWNCSSIIPVDDNSLVCPPRLRECNIRNCVLDPSIWVALGHAFAALSHKMDKLHIDLMGRREMIVRLFSSALFPGLVCAKRVILNFDRWTRHETNSLFQSWPYETDTIEDLELHHLVLTKKDIAKLTSTKDRTAFGLAWVGVDNKQDDFKQETLSTKVIYLRMHHCWHTQKLVRQKWRNTIDTSLLQQPHLMSSLEQVNVRHQAWFLTCFEDMPRLHTLVLRDMTCTRDFFKTLASLRNVTTMHVAGAQGCGAKEWTCDAAHRFGCRSELFKWGTSDVKRTLSVHDNFFSNGWSDSEQNCRNAFCQEALKHNIHVRVYSSRYCPFNCHSQD